jgi:hypothetical protein
MRSPTRYMVDQQTSRLKGINSGPVSRILRPQNDDSLLLEVDANLGLIIEPWTTLSYNTALLQLEGGSYSRLMFGDLLETREGRGKRNGSRAPASNKTSRRNLVPPTFKLQTTGSHADMASDPSVFTAMVSRLGGPSDRSRGTRLGS